MHAAAQRLDEWKTWLVRLLFLALLCAAVLVVRHQLLSEHPRSQLFVQRIRMVNPQPPPAPRPHEESKAESAKQESKPEEAQTQRGIVALAEPSAGPAGPPGPPGPPGARPSGDQLGVDTEGEGSGDSFGLVARRGGRDITTIGGGGGGGGASRPIDNRLAYSGYGRLVAQKLADTLQQNPALVEHEYMVVVLVWIDGRGRIVRSELTKSSGFIEVDSALRDALADARILPEPPGGLPQPLKLRFTTKEVEQKSG